VLKVACVPQAEPAQPRLGTWCECWTLSASAGRLLCAAKTGRRVRCPAARTTSGQPTGSKAGSAARTPAATPHTPHAQRRPSLAAQACAAADPPNTYQTTSEHTHSHSDRLRAAPCDPRAAAALHTCLKRATHTNAKSRTKHLPWVLGDATTAARPHVDGSRANV
jgi:hypothetical protein